MIHLFFFLFLNYCREKLEKTKFNYKIYKNKLDFFFLIKKQKLCKKLINAIYLNHFYFSNIFFNLFLGEIN